MLRMLRRYELRGSSLGDLCMHLTNYSINKDHDTFTQPSSEVPPICSRPHVADYSISPAVRNRRTASRTSVWSRRC